MDWQAQISAEFEKAEQARLRGNEGRARVCARRAAGFAIREHLLRRGLEVRSASALDLLEELKARAGFSPALLPIVDHLLLHVDEEFTLPADIDLVAEARQLCYDLLLA